MVSGKEKEKSAAVTATVGMEGPPSPQAASAKGAIRLKTKRVHNRYILFTAPSFYDQKLGRNQAKFRFIRMGCQTPEMPHSVARNPAEKPCCDEMSWRITSGLGQV